MTKKKTDLEEEKITIGFYEKVKVFDKNGEEGEDTHIARVDTGATMSSIDLVLAGRYNLGPILRTKYVKNAHGNKLRPIVEAELIIAGKKVKGEFTLSDRSNMKYPILIGQNLLIKGFIIDPLFSR